MSFPTDSIEEFIMFCFIVFFGGSLLTWIAIECGYLIIFLANMGR